MLHQLSLRVQRGQEIDADIVRVLIDGVDLAALVRPLPERYDTDERVAVLACVCGEVGCWPLRVRIQGADREVRWSDFQQPHRPGWSYAGFGPFVFDRASYDAEIQRVTAGSLR